MIVFLNFTPRDEPYGGANNFLRTLMLALAERGLEFTNDPSARADVALLNALTDGLRLEDVQRIAECGIPIVHRKTGFRARGAAGLRSVVEGVVLGDAHQIAFTPYLTHTIFQSDYSRRVFEEGGFTGPSTVIPNGVDTRVFFPRPTSAPWQPGTPLRLVISTWSTDASKGFAHFAAIDAALTGRTDVSVTLVGRTPPGTQYREIQVRPPLAAAELAELVRAHDAVLQLTEHESCSNALIEAFSCGLPAIYLESGANTEMAERFGVPWQGDINDAIARLGERYAEFRTRLEANPYTIDQVADRYADVLSRAAAAGAEASSAQTAASVSPNAS